MNPKPISLTLQLRAETAKRLLDECQKQFLTPKQVIAKALGLDFTEPAIINIPESYAHVFPAADFVKENRLPRKRGHQEDLYLLILSQIIKGVSSEKFGSAATQIDGTKRIYFSKDKNEIESTGSSNTAKRIPQSDWYAAVNNPYDRKEKILSELMERLGFSDDYIWLLSKVPSFEQLRLRGVAFKVE
jgi:hypothetical protein